MAEPTHSSFLARLPAVRSLIDLALSEDLGRGDITTESVFGGPGPLVRAVMVAREPLVVFGVGIAQAVFELVQPSLLVTVTAQDGDRLEGDGVILSVEGDAASILRAERTAVNFIQRLSGIASLARLYSQAVSGTNARVVDTRKTTPGYRVLEKGAVRAGGCFNHRADLGSGILIKDNHIAAAGSVEAAVRAAKLNAPHSLRIEVEIDRVDQLDEAIDAGAELVLLDNMEPATVAAAAEKAHARGVRVEVSGGITLDTVRSYAEAGADIISSGALTHSATAVDIALDFHP